MSRCTTPKGWMAGWEEGGGGRCGVDYKTGDVRQQAAMGPTARAGSGPPRLHVRQVPPRWPRLRTPCLRAHATPSLPLPAPGAFATAIPSDASILVRSKRGPGRRMRAAGRKQHRALRTAATTAAHHAHTPQSCPRSRPSTCSPGMLLPVQAAVDELCQGRSAGRAFLRAVRQGGAAARAWIAAWLYANCPAADEAGRACLAAVVQEAPSTALAFAQNWVDACQEMGIGESPLNQRSSLRRCWSAQLVHGATCAMLPCLQAPRVAGPRGHARRAFCVLVCSLRH